jgi:hypothetical protein
MKIQVAKRDLVDALNVVANSYNPSGTDITAHFVFRADDDGNVKVFTFAGRLFSEAPVKCVAEDTDEVKAFTVEGARLLAWTKAAKDAALELEFDPETKIVSATSPRGTMEFQSLDPQNFPFWDAMWADVEEKGTIRADKLLAALNYSRSFSFDKETKKPQLCLIECRNGMLWSTDEKAITLVEVAGLENSNLRIHRNDTAGVQKFLGTCGESEITLMEHDRSLLFKRADGAVFGESRFTAQYPSLNVNRDGEATVWWSLPLEEIVEGIPYLRSGSSKEDSRLFFNREGDGPVKMGMVAKTANRMDIEVSVAESGAADGGALPDDGFVLDCDDLLKVLGPWEGDTVTFSIHTKGNKGYVRFREVRDDIDYLTVLSWVRR